MPTSSIFTNIVINDPEKVEKFIDALEASSHDPACVNGDSDRKDRS